MLNQPNLLQSAELDNWFLSTFAVPGTIIPQESLESIR